MAKVSVIGLGKLGAPLAAVMASHGHTTIGVDVSLETVTAINNGEAPVEETGLAHLMRQDSVRANLSATRDWGEAIKQTDISLIIVPTPSLKDGSFTNQYVLEAVEKIGVATRNKSTYHLVVVCSTVMPGSTSGVIRKALEGAAQQQLGDRLGLAYSPEFIALGSVIHDMQNPDMILIGESDSRAGAMLEELLTSVVSQRKRSSVQRMTLTNAELAKIAVNTYITMKISFANTIAEMCEKLPTGDAHQVLKAVGSDTRIGSKYISPGTAYSGPCFPRDNIAFSRFAREIGVEPHLAEATERVNQTQTDRLLRIVQEQKILSDRVGILGLSYKPHTSVTEESPGLSLARRLITRGARVVVYDPEVKDRSLLPEAEWATKSSEVMESCNVVVVTTPWPEFTGIPWSLYSGVTVVDCWGLLNDYVKNVIVVKVGQAP